MDTLSFGNKLLNGISPTDFLVYFIFATLGIIVFIVLQQVQRKKEKSEKTASGIGDWIKKNKARVLLTFLAVIIGILFTEDVLGIKLNNWGAMSVGLSTDVIIEKIIAIFGKKNEN